MFSKPAVGDDEQRLGEKVEALERRVCRKLLSAEAQAQLDTLTTPTGKEQVQTASCPPLSILDLN